MGIIAFLHPLLDENKPQTISAVLYIQYMPGVDWYWPNHPLYFSLPYGSDVFPSEGMSMSSTKFYFLLVTEQEETLQSSKLSF